MSEEQFGLQHKLGNPIAMTRLAEQPLVCMPPMQVKFTYPEWKTNNEMLFRNAEDQTQLVHRVIAECDRVVHETDDRCETLSSTAERRIEERIGDVEFIKNELMIQRKEIYDELEALSMKKVRLQDCLSSLQTNALTISQKCLILREGRIGLELVSDAVDKALQTEITTVIGGQSLLNRALEQLNEQMRRLRATRYLLDRDLQYKQSAIDIDKECLSLKHTNMCLSIYEGYNSLDTSNISANEYNEYSANNIKKAAQEVSSSRPIKVMIDTLIRQVIDDLRTAMRKCNHEFKERIIETRISKNLLEEMHKQMSEKIVDMNDNIIKLQKALSDKEGRVGLVHTRLGKRAQRNGAELVRDPASQALYYENELLRESTEQLQQMLLEANAALRYLLQTQLQLEEEINIKMNSLKIDEVDCMTLRCSMDFHDY